MTPSTLAAMAANPAIFYRPIVHFASETSKYASILFLDAQSHLLSDLIRLYPCTIKLSPIKLSPITNQPSAESPDRPER